MRFSRLKPLLRKRIALPTEAGECCASCSYPVASLSGARKGCGEQLGGSREFQRGNVAGELTGLIFI